MKVSSTDCTATLQPNLSGSPTVMQRMSDLMASVRMTRNIPECRPGLQEGQKLMQSLEDWSNKHQLSEEDFNKHPYVQVMLRNLEEISTSTSDTAKRIRKEFPQRQMVSGSIEVDIHYTDS